MRHRSRIGTAGATLRWAIIGIAVLFAVPGVLPQVSGAPSVTGVEAVGITVSDMDRAVEFYSKVLTFEKMSDAEISGENYEHLEGVFGARARIVSMRLGNERVELTEYLAPRGRRIPEDSRSNDRSFQHIAIIVSDMDRAYQWLRQNHVEHASSGPQTLPDWNKNAGGIRAFYFKDPDGHPVEVLQFPPGKGAERWHVTDRLFLGIDHTAIVVSDTDSSLKFYRDLLGMQVAGGSENYGTEQEHLNNVFGARLRITSLRGSAGYGIELLEYLAPRDGKGFPPDERANDILHRQTVLSTPNIDESAKALIASRVFFVSSGVIANPLASGGVTKAVVVRDPDGHAIELVERK